MIADTAQTTIYLAAAHFFRDGAEVITFDDFARALERSIGANRDYAKNCYPTFQSDPAGYLASRNPQTQSEELIAVMLRRLDETAGDTGSGKRAPPPAGLFTTS
jgi:hypothetical protein